MVIPLDLDVPVIKSLSNRIRDITSCRDSQIQYMQDNCNHSDVIQSRFKDGVIVTYWPRRLCLDCMMEEEAHNWPNYREMTRSTEKTTVPTRINTDEVKNVNIDEYFLIRDNVRSKFM